MSKEKVLLHTERIEMSSEILRALAHPLRIRILGFIDKKGTINVNKIYNTLNLEQSITSQHLRVLRLAGLVNTKREGKFIHYSINYPKMEQVVAAVKRFSEATES